MAAGYREGPLPKLRTATMSRLNSVRVAALICACSARVPSDPEAILRSYPQKSLREEKFDVQDRH